MTIVKLITKDTNYLDYTFLSHRNTLSNLQTLNVKNTKDYLFDLNHTLELNMELLEKSIQCWGNKKERENLLNYLNEMKNKYNNKNQFKKELSTKSSKILIEKQIIEELKRKIEENSEFFKEQIKENEESSDGKSEYIKICGKKLQEIEIHVQKLTKNLVDSPYLKYKDFKMNTFLEQNTSLCKTKELLKKEKNQMEQLIKELKHDNIVYKEEMKKDQEENQQSHKKIKEFINLYRKKIMMLESKIKIIKSSFSNLSNRVKNLTIPQTFVKIDDKQLNNHQETIYRTTTFNNNMQTQKDYEQDQEKSMLPLDMTRKINNLMDFSTILNKKQLDETKFEDLGKTTLGNGLCNVTNQNMWDISCINKN